MSASVGGIEASRGWIEGVTGPAVSDDFSEGVIPLVVGTVAQKVVELSSYAICCLSILFSASLTVGSLLSGTLISNMPSILTGLAFSGLSFYVALNYVNLHDPETRERIRQEIEFEFEDFKLQRQEEDGKFLQKEAETFIQNVAARYSWSSLIKYGIPRPQTLSEIVAFQAPILGPKKYADLYKTLLHHIQNSALTPEQKAAYRIPSPHTFAPLWRAQLFEKCETIEGFVSFIETLDVTVLEKTSVVEERDAALLTEIKSRVLEAKSTYIQNTAESRSDRERAIAPIRAEHAAVCEKAKREYASDPIHAELRVHRRDFLTLRAKIESLIRQDPDRAQVLKEFEEGASRLALLSSEHASAGMRDYVAAQRKSIEKRRDEGLAHVAKKFKRQKEQIAARYQREKGAALRHLKSAQIKRDTAIRKANEVFYSDAKDELEMYNSLTREQRITWTRIAENMRLQTRLLLRGEVA